MTHSCTFPLSAELSALFEAENGAGASVSVIKVSIADETFVLSGTAPLGANAEGDFAKAKGLLRGKEESAAYLIFRLKRGAEKQSWLLISFVPDEAPVKDKMLYSSAKDTLKKDLGQDKIAQEMHFSHIEDVELKISGPMSTEEHHAAVAEVMTETERLVPSSAPRPPPAASCPAVACLCALAPALAGPTRPTEV